MSVKAIRAQEIWEVGAPQEITVADVARRTGEVVLGLISGDVLVLDAEGREAQRLHGEGDPVRAVSITDDGLSFAFARSLGVELWNRHGRRLDQLGLRDVTALDLRRRDGRIFAVSAGRCLISVARRGPSSRVDPLEFDAVAVRAGDRGWDVAVSGASGDMAVFGDGLDLRWVVSLSGSSGSVTGDVVGRLILFPAEEWGLAAFDPDGVSLGVYDTPTPPVLASASPGAGHIAVAGEEGAVYLLTRERGMCIWREEGRGPLAALGLGENRLVTVSRDGRIRSLRLGSEEASRAEFLELCREDVATRREPDWTLDLPPLPGGFRGRLALSRDGRWAALRYGSSLALWNEAGQRVGVRDVEPTAEPFWGQGERLFLKTSREVQAFETDDFAARGPLWSRRLACRAASAGDHAKGLALVDDAGTVRVLDPDTGEDLWERELPETPVDLHADEDLEAVGVLGAEGGFYLLDREGRPLWKRTPGRGARALLADKHVFFATPEGVVSCFGYGEHRDWRMESGARVSHLFREGAVAFLATRGNRFFRLEASGGLTPLDRRAETGTSRLARTEAGVWREVHVRGDRLTCFDLKARILWYWKGAAEITPASLSSGTGRVALVCGSTLAVFSLEETASPSRYLEI